MDEIPFDDRKIPRAEIEWERSLWWWYPLTRAIHPATRLTSLLVASIAILLAQVALSFASWIFAPRWSSDLRQLWSLNELQSEEFSELSVMVGGAATGASGYSSFILIVPNTQAIFRFASQGQLFESVGLREISYLTFLAVGLACLVAIAGGILARRSVVELGQRTIAPWGATFKLVFSRWASYLWATGMVVVGVGAMLLVPWGLGLVARISWLSAVAGILLLVFFLPLVFNIGRLLIIGVVCYPLSVCAISTEKNADAFEGFSRSAAYFFQRPVIVAMLVILLACVGWVGYQIVFWTIAGGWYLTRDAFLLGAGIQPSELQQSSSTNLSAAAMRLAPWVLVGSWLARLLIVSYGFSYFWSASAATYLIVRKCVDQTEFDEMDIQEPEIEQPLPEILPPTPAEKEDKSPAAAES